MPKTVNDEEEDDVQLEDESKNKEHDTHVCWDENEFPDAPTKGK